VISWLRYNGVVLSLIFPLFSLGLDMINVDMMSCNTIQQVAYTHEFSLINLFHPNFQLARIRTCRVVYVSES
jgi:hypothetical protein